MSRTSSVAVAFGLACSLVACRDGGGGGGDDQPVVDAPPVGGAVTIQEVQNDAMAPGTPVELKGVVVTAIDTFGMRTGDFWVQEPAGGEFSGVHVFGAPLDQVGALALGDVVDIIGAEKDEFALSSDMSGKTITELKPINGGTMMVTKVGSGTPVTPMVVDALAIGQKATQAERDAEWEKWEGVLITVNNVTNFNLPQCVGSACSDPTLEKFDVTGQLVIESALAGFPMTGLARNGCVGSVTGVVDYFFDYLLYPRTTDELVTGGSGCPAPEAAPLCADSIDNDGNGFDDCNDNNCITSEATCRATTTISAIQAATPTGGVELGGAVVVALSKATSGGKRYNMWISTSGQAAPNEGVYIYGPGADLSAFTVGSKVDVIGTVEEFNDSTGTETLTEIKALSIVAATGAAAVMPVSGQTAATLTVAATGEPYEGVLVKLTDVKVTVVGTSGTFGVGAMQQGGTTFKTDDSIATPVGPVDTCFAEITGIWTYLPYEDAYGFLPLGPGTGTGTCL